MIMTMANVDDRSDQNTRAAPVQVEAVAQLAAGQSQETLGAANQEHDRGVAKVTAGYARKPVKMRFPNNWEFMDTKERRENWIDKYSIYGKSSDSNGSRLPIPGQRGGLVRELSDIGWREERGYIKKVTGFPLSAAVSGMRGDQNNKRRVRHLSPIRVPTANTICDEYNWLHNGLHGKMLLSNKKYRHILPTNVADSHEDGHKLHYCEVLGQRVCADCIEHTNRTMAIEYQHEAFPEIEVSASRLVAPKLSKMLADRLKSGVAMTERTEDSRGPANEGPSGIFGDRGSPPPYRQPSALRNQQRVTIYSDAMINSLHQTLKRDRRMTAENLHDIREMRLLKGKRNTMRQLPIHKIHEIID